MGWKRRVTPTSPTSAKTNTPPLADTHIVTDGAVLDELSRVFDAGERANPESAHLQRSPQPAVSTRAKISIVDDDLPDVVYAENAAHMDAPKVRPVFIDDDGAIDAVQPTQPPQP